MTVSAWILFWLATGGALASLAALVAGRHLGWGNLLWFAVSLPVVELPLFHVGLATTTLVALAAFGALSAAPGQLAVYLVVASAAVLLVVHRRALPTGGILDEALEETLGPSFRAAIPAPRQRLLGDGEPGLRRLARPFALRSPGVVRQRDVAYGPHPQQKLDIYRAAAGARGDAPVLIQLHGGGWITGSKNDQALPLVYHLAARGWVVVAADYRLSPAARFPDALVDCKRVVAWVRQHALEQGADPQFIAITGGSAGAHLASLVALTPCQSPLQPGFEDADTRVSACVSLYGVYDFLDRHGVRRDGGAMTDLLARIVMPAAPADAAALWDLASPLAQCGPDAPPFLVLHGTHDSMAKVEEARLFVSRLRECSTAPVVYGELPGGQHAWDLFHSVRCAATVRAVAWFLEWSRVAARR